MTGSWLGSLSIWGTILAVVLALGCVVPPAPLAPLGLERSVENLDADEAALWKDSREIQYKIEVSGLLFEDAALESYMQQVLKRVTPAEVTQAGIEPKIRIISDVNIDGYSFANGVIYIHTGLLSRMQSESQLAALLSRELAHVVQRHALQAQRDKRLRADTMAWIGVGATVVEGGANYALLIKAASMTSAVGFAHHLETAADAKGLAIMEAADYPVAETLGLYDASLAHLAEVHLQGAWGWAPFAPPPPITARITGYKALIATQYADQAAGRPPIEAEPGFRRRVHRATLHQCDLELAKGLFVSAETCARLATESGPRDAKAWTTLGRALAGQRANPLAGREIPPIQDVRGAYAQALSVDARKRRSDARARHDLLPAHRHGALARGREQRAAPPEALPAPLARCRRSRVHQELHRRARSGVEVMACLGERSLRNLLIGCFAVLGTGCAPAWVAIDEQSQRPFTYPTFQVSFDLPIGWMTSYYGPVAGHIFFTVHGAELEEIWVRRFPKDAIVKGTNRNTAGELTVQDIAKISIDSRRTDEGVGAFELVSNKPAKVDGQSCFRLDYRYRNAIGLQKRTVEYGCPVGTWLYRIEFNAPTQHYFGRYLPDFETMTRSMRFDVPGA